MMDCDQLGRECICQRSRTWQPAPRWLSEGLFGLGKLIESLGLVEYSPASSAFAEPAQEIVSGDFEMRSYDVTDQADLPNFKFGDFEAGWYKHAGRGLVISRSVDQAEWLEMFSEIVGRLSDGISRNDN